MEDIDNPLATKVASKDDSSNEEFEYVGKLLPSGYIILLFTD